tara:strand:- start:1830 stop:2513 length:684 start_codon:yes stop_codon:yes gene_type:complete
MLSQHWTDFAPLSSTVDNFHGGVFPELKHSGANCLKRNFTAYGDTLSPKDPDEGDPSFCAVNYRLRVAPEQNGWHHFVGMYTSTQGVAWANACIKEDCRPGDYQFLLHFNFVKPNTYESVPDTGSRDGGTSNNYNYFEASYRRSLFYGQDSASYGTSQSGTWGSGLSDWRAGSHMDIMVLRPTLVDPTNANTFVNLWSPGNYPGWQMYFTGIPIMDPNRVTSSGLGS